MVHWLHLAFLVLLLSSRSCFGSGTSYYHTMESIKVASKPCAEIVTFSLKDTATPSQFISYAKDTAGAFQEFGGCLSRTLTNNDSNGMWTDYVLWQDKETAMRAAAVIPQDTRFANFGNAIDPETVVMRHELVEWQWKGEGVP